jgi:hypothetical protein
MEPATKRGFSGVENSSATCFRQDRGGFVQFVGAIGQIILRQHDRGAAKGVGFDHIGPGF